MVDKKWMKKAFANAHGQLRAHFGVKEGETIPMGKMQAEMAKLHEKAAKRKLTAAELRLERRIALVMAARY